MLDSIYHMTNTLKSHFWRKNVIILSLCTQCCYECHNVSLKSINHYWFIIYCMALFHSHTRRHMIKCIILFIIVVPSDPLPDVQIVTSTSNTFKVTWTPYSCETKDVSYVEFYIVSYCKVSESKNCTQESCE